MFKLNIECSKNIDELHINFSDGSSSVVNSDKPAKKIKKSSPTVHETNEVGKVTNKPAHKDNNFLDLDADYGNVSQKIVELPDVTKGERKTNVASELQNLDI